MKTHIIHLEQDDNVISITDKLSWGKAQRVLLVYPSSPGLTLQKLDLLLIKRAAYKMGFSVAIVSRSKPVRLLARDLAIPVFRSINHAQKRTWVEEKPVGDRSRERKPVDEIRKMGVDARKTEPKWLNLLSVRLLFFSLGVLAVLIVFILFIPSAKIELNLPDEIQSVFLTVVADESVDIVNLSGIIPAHMISVSVEASGLVDITSTTNVPDQYATGKILFMNLTETQIEIPLGTIVARLDDAGVRFEVIERGEVPAGLGKSLELQVRALTPGVAGNMDANTLGSLLGDLGTALTAINPAPTFGGADRLTKMPSQNDRERLFNNLETELRAKAIQSAREQLSEADIIFPDSAVLVEGSQEVVYVPAEGQAGDRLSLDLKGTYSILYAEYTDLLILAEPALTAELPENYEPVSDGSIKFDLLNPPTMNSTNRATLHLEVTRKIIRKLDPISISNLIKGMTINDAYNILKKKYGPQMEPVIKVTPSWWPKLPLVTMRIAISN